ncbi:helix-turn-helix transcriptional regulator [Streptomyces sp. NPDC056738]|uniref:helix-turn-helix transcriptional regulator n=1 Tax=Streptomyces sp. NPDC056738 TaxID=3345933 RepID=UPI0036CA26D7
MPNDPMPDWVLTRRRAVGDQIRAARLSHKLSQEKLGELVGLDRKTVNRIEQGAYATLLDHLILIAQALDVPLSELVQ